MSGGLGSVVKMWEVTEGAGRNAAQMVWHSCLNRSLTLVMIGNENSLSRELSSGEINEIDPKNTCRSSVGGCPDPFGKFEIHDTPIKSK